MSQVHANPEEIRLFASNLKQFNEQLRQSMSVLNGQFSRLEETWQDQKHQIFAQEYIQTMRMIDRFLQIADNHIPFLVKEADILQEYLQHRMR